MKPQKENPRNGCNRPGVDAVTSRVSGKYNPRGCESQHDSIIDQVSAALQRGERITAGDCLRRFGGFRMAAVVHELKRRGLPIQSERAIVKCADGRAACVAIYSMRGG